MDLERLLYHARPHFVHYRNHNGLKYSLETVSPYDKDR